MQAVKADSNIIDQGIDGTCHWEEVQEGDDVVLNVHAGKLDDKSGLPQYVNKIVIDPGVVAPQNSWHLFSDNSASEIDGLNNLDTSHVTNMSEMFFDSTNLKSLDMSNWDTSNVTNMNAMFSTCQSLTNLDLSSFDTTKVINMEDMFCANFKLKKLDLSNFYTPNLIYADYTFYNVNFESLDIRNFDTSKLKPGYFFEVATIGKLTVGKNFKNVDFPQIYKGRIYNLDNTKRIGISENWIALNGPEKGVKKNYRDMTDVTRTETVTYVPETKPLLDNYTEYKTITRTINLHLPKTNGNDEDEILSFIQKANIHRQVTINNDNSKTYGEWSKDYWEEYKAPSEFIESPKPAKVDKKIVDGNTQDQTVDIYY